MLTHAVLVEEANWQAALQGGCCYARLQSEKVGDPTGVSEFAQRCPAEPQSEQSGLCSCPSQSYPGYTVELPGTQVSA